MFVLWVSAALGLDEVVTPVHSSWPLGLPDAILDGSNGQYNADNSGIRINCSQASTDDPVGVRSINTLYMTKKCNKQYVTPDGQFYTLVPMDTSDETNPVYIQTRGASVAPKRHERNGNVLDIVNVTHRNLNETANNEWGNVTNLKIAFPVVGGPYLYTGQKRSDTKCRIKRLDSHTNTYTENADLDGDLLDEVSESVQKLSLIHI